MGYIKTYVWYIVAAAIADGLDIPIDIKHVMVRGGGVLRGKANWYAERW